MNRISGALIRRIPVAAVITGLVFCLLPCNASEINFIDEFYTDTFKQDDELNAPIRIDWDCTGNGEIKLSRLPMLKNPFAKHNWTEHLQAFDLCIVDDYLFVINNDRNRDFLSGFDVFKINLMLGSFLPVLSHINTYHDAPAPLCNCSPAIAFNEIDARKTQGIYEVFLVDDHNGLRKVEFDPGDGTLNLTGWRCGQDFRETHGVKLHNGSAYIVRYFWGLYAFDADDSGAMIETGHLDLNDRLIMEAVDLKDYGTATYAFVVEQNQDRTPPQATCNPQLRVVDVTSSPFSLTASLDLEKSAFDIVIDGSTAYIANGMLGLKIVDIANPAAPGVIASFDTPGKAVGVCKHNDIVFLADESAGVHAFDVSQPAAPVRIGGFDTWGQARKPWIYDPPHAGSFCYVAYSEHGVIALSADLNACCPSGTVTSDILNFALPMAQSVAAVRFVATDQVPPGTGIQYYVTNHPDAVTWEPVQSGQIVVFDDFGNSVRWRADLQADAAAVTSPVIDSVELTIMY